MIDHHTWRSAHVLLARYGTDAILIAAKRADALLVEGNEDASAAWVGIADAIRELEQIDCPKPQRLR